MGTRETLNRRNSTKKLRCCVSWSRSVLRMRSGEKRREFARKEPTSEIYRWVIHSGESLPSRKKNNQSRQIMRNCVVSGWSGLGSSVRLFAFAEAPTGSHWWELGLLRWGKRITFRVSLRCYCCIAFLLRSQILELMDFAHSSRLSLLPSGTSKRYLIFRWQLHDIFHLTPMFLTCVFKKGIWEHVYWHDAHGGGTHGNRSF